MTEILSPAWFQALAILGDVQSVKCYSIVRVKILLLRILELYKVFLSPGRVGISCCCSIESTKCCSPSMQDCRKCRSIRHCSQSSSILSLSTNISTSNVYQGKCRGRGTNSNYIRIYINKITLT